MSSMTQTFSIIKPDAVKAKYRWQNYRLFRK